MYYISLHLLISVWNSFIHVCTFNCILHGKKSLKENACNILGQKTMITLQQGKTKYPCLYYGCRRLRGTLTPPPLPPNPWNIITLIPVDRSVIYISIISNQAFVFPLPFSMILGAGFWLVLSEPVSFSWRTTVR